MRKGPGCGARAAYVTTNGACKIAAERAGVRARRIGNHRAAVEAAAKGAAQVIEASGDGRRRDVARHPATWGVAGYRQTATSTSASASGRASSATRCARAPNQHPWFLDSRRGPVRAIGPLTNPKNKRILHRTIRLRSRPGFCATEANRRPPRKNHELLFLLRRSWRLGGSIW